jgi:hypothetical protein
MMAADVSTSKLCYGYDPVKRPAFTLLELSAAAAITAMFLAASLQMLRALSAYDRSAQRRAYAQQALAAVAEQAAGTPWDKLSSDSPPTIGIPQPLKKYLPNAKLTIAVAEETSPAAKRIMLELNWNDPRGRETRPERLTTWAFPPARQPR